MHARNEPGQGTGDEQLAPTHSLEQLCLGASLACGQALAVASAILAVLQEAEAQGELSAASASALTTFAALLGLCGHVCSSLHRAEHRPHWQQAQVEGQVATLEAALRLGVRLQQAEEPALCQAGALLAEQAASASFECSKSWIYALKERVPSLEGQAAEVLLTHLAALASTALKTAVCSKAEGAAGHGTVDLHSLPGYLVCLGYACLSAADLVRALPPQRSAKADR
ncbi:hypothetical protein ABPG75_005575 [Micractinium tetrahymenae]